MNSNGVWTALVVVLGSMVLGFLGKVFLVGGLLGWSLPTFLVGLGLTLLSPLLLFMGIIYAVYSFFRTPDDAKAGFGGARVYESGDLKAYCWSCGRVIQSDGNFCNYCGRTRRPTFSTS
jgi:hypothetical protein